MNAEVDRLRCAVFSKENERIGALAMGKFWSCFCRFGCMLAPRWFISVNIFPAVVKWRGGAPPMFVVYGSSRGVCSSICRCNNESLCYPSRSWACTLGEDLYFSVFFFFMMFENFFVCVIEKWHAGQVSWVFVISSNKFKMLQRVPAPNSNTFVDFSPSFRKFSSTWSLSKAKAPYRLSMETTLHLAHAICFSRIRKIVVSVIKWESLVLLKTSLLSIGRKRLISPYPKPKKRRFTFSYVKALRSALFLCSCDVLQIIYIRSLKFGSDKIRRMVTWLDPTSYFSSTILACATAAEYASSKIEWSKKRCTMVQGAGGQQMKLWGDSLCGFFF